MNQDSGYKILCPRCGSEMNSNSRYCMKCGYLNTSNEANQNMKQYVPKEEVNSYQIGQGQVIDQNNQRILNSVGFNTGNRRVCFLLNYLLYLVIIIGSFVLMFKDSVITLDVIKNSLYPILAFEVSILFLFIYSMELIFMKCNKKWYYALIPIYNLFILTEIVFNKRWLGILLLIPVVGQIFFLVILYILGTKFKYNGLLTMLFPIIFIPLMGFGTKFFEGRNYLNENNTLENDYRRKKIFFITIMIFLVSSFIILFWTNILDIKNRAKKITNYYYVYASHQIVEKTKVLGEENYLLCDDYDYSSTSGIYYVQYPDMGAVAHFPFYYLRDVIGGYVIIDNNSGNYYISMSDGTFGFPQLNINDVKLENIEEYSNVEYKDKNSVNYCINTKTRIHMNTVN